MPCRDDIDDVLKGISQLSVLDDVVEYLASTIEEVTDWSSPAPLTDALSDMLVGYGAAADEDEAAAICIDIHTQLQKSGIAEQNVQKIKKLGETVNLKARVEQQTEQRKTV